MIKEKIIYILLYVIFWLVRGFVALRYRLEVKGLKALTPEIFQRPGGILFLPNHPAEIDPVLLEMVLWRRFRPRPLVIEHFYRIRGIRFFVDLVKALELPTMDRLANKWRGQKVEKQFTRIVEELKKGENFLIYPSGRLKLSGSELLGGASLVHRLLHACPEANVVLIRTTGLWGSLFSRALTGESPSFGKALWQGLKIVLKNGVFWTPRRQVLIELEVPNTDFLWQASRVACNRSLEEWYNQRGEEPLTLVSYAFWKKELPQVMASKVSLPSIREAQPIPKKMETEVLTFLATLALCPLEKIERHMHLAQDLGLDSLDMAQVYLFIEERYEVPQVIPGELHRVEDVLQAAAGYLEAPEQAVEGIEFKKRTWPQEKSRPMPFIPEGGTVQEVFLKSVTRCAPFLACTDALTPPLSYRRLKQVALLLSYTMRRVSGTHIGVMLPASVGAYLVVLAILFAKKIPVMLNWTVGVRALDHAVELTGLKHVVTSWKFLDRLDTDTFGKVEGMFLFLEEIKEEISWKEKWQVMVEGILPDASLLRRYQLDAVSPQDTAVILFTSGTESLPKGVPLSHHNLLSNQRACLEVISLTDQDILYGILPPFHSFGFSVTGMLPLLAGLKVCYAPDPTDSRGMAKDIEEWKPTLLSCAPSFLTSLFRVAQPHALHSLRFVVSGAEKTPQELFDYVQTHLPQARMLEGYGITECSPVVTLDRLEEPHCGVGKPLPGVQIQVIDSLTHRPLPIGEEGEICIAGPSVFSHYLGKGADPFIMQDGIPWYLSGDRGSLTQSGHLLLVGRLKRFIKIGGEMVSLGGLEEELMRLAHEHNWITALKEEGPALAISAREKQTDKPRIVLFTTFPVSKEEVNHALKLSGSGRLAKISEVHTLEQIPLTGTGKTHYRLLDEMVL